MVKTPRKPYLIEYPESDGLPMSESDITRHYLIYCVEAMRIFFQSRPQVYVSGNMFIYYEEGNPTKSLSPDVFVVYGVNSYERRTYKVWEEGKVPAFVLEITSKTTRRKDEVEKPLLYAQLGVQEYFQYDPSGDYLNPRLKGGQLNPSLGRYEPIASTQREDGTLSMFSDVLGLELRVLPPAQVDCPINGVEPKHELRLFDPKTGVQLMTHIETERDRQVAVAAQKLAEQAQQAAEQAQQAAEAERETERRRAELAEQRLAELMAQLGTQDEEG